MEQQLDKLSRGDLIKLVGQQVLDELADETQRAGDAIVTAQEQFQRAVIYKAKHDNLVLLTNMAAVSGCDEQHIMGMMPRVIYADQALPDTVPVVLVNSLLPHDQRMRIEVRVQLVGSMLELAQGLQKALAWRDEAESRDKKVSVIREKVRRDLVDTLLKGPEGEAVKTAARELAKAVKEQLLKGGNNAPRS